MKYLLLLSIFFSFSIASWSQGSETLPIGDDPFAANEGITSSPQTGSLGQFGDIKATPYNGRAGINIPIYTLNWEGLQLPINMSYDSGGIRIASEASWIGQNWSLSGNYGVHRKVYGQDDFNEKVSAIYSNPPKSGFIYNPLELILEEGEEQPRLSHSDIIDVHHSFAIPTTPGRQSASRDTQPDVFTLNVFNTSYTFIFNKKESSSILTTKVFNNNNAIITYDLSTKSFYLLDENGFEYFFETKETNTNFSTVQNDLGPATNYQAAINGLFSTYNRDDNGITTFWHLDKVISPKGRELDFSYQQGLNFSFPSHSINIDGRDGNNGQGSAEQVSGGLTKKPHNVSTTIIENNYLTEISGDFGKIRFTLGSREDLATGHTINELANGTFVGGVLITGKGTHIRSCHGTTASCGTTTSLKPWKLNRIDVEDFAGNSILDAVFDYDYYNSNRLGTSIQERYVRLKLDGVNINGKEYTFNYNSENTIAPKDGFGVDFWGYDNGMTSNTILVPKIGRFVTTHLSGTNFIAQTFFTYPGAIRKSNFNYGQRGSLSKIVYPTGGSTSFEYEPHDIVMAAARPFVKTKDMTENNAYNGSSRIQWTDMIDESKFKSTYQYLKYASDPSYNYFEKELPDLQGEAIEIPLGLNQSFTVDFPSLIDLEGRMQTHMMASTLEFWGSSPMIVLLNLNTGEETTIFTYGEAPGPDSAFVFTDVSKTLSVLPGEYVIVPRSVQIPAGDDWNDYPATPIVEYHSDQLLLHTFESLTDDELAQFIERFEIGGLRVKSILNETKDGDFASKTMYAYENPNGLPGLMSSGKLMDDLIFYSKASGYHSYNPRTYGDFTLTGTNVVGGNNSAQGSHIGYSFIKEFAVDENDQSQGWVETEFYNEKNDYFTESFNLPWSYNAATGNGDNMVDIFWDLVRIEWVCSGWDLNNDCAGEMRMTSTLGYAEVKNTTLLGLPLKLNYSYINGNVKEVRIFDIANNMVEKTTNSYVNLNGQMDVGYFASFLNTPVPLVYTLPDGTVMSAIWGSWEEGDWGANHHTYFPYSFPIHHGLVSKLSSSEKTQYFSTDTFSNETEISYNPDTHFTRSNTVISNETERVTTNYFYPKDSEVFNNTNVYRLRDQNRLSSVIRSEQYKDDLKISSSEVGYGHSSTTSNLTLPIVVKSSKGDNTLDDQIKINKYDQFGNVLEKETVDGGKSAYVWGYNSLYPFAKIDNASYAQVLSTGVNLSILNSSTASDAQKRIELNKIRDGLGQSMVTTYTYDPLIGMTSSTDPRGYTMYYEYDDENRLKLVRDGDGNILSENEYNYGINN